MTKSRDIVASPPPRPEPDVQQIVYALERVERRLLQQADELHQAHDYSAEFPAEDASRMREAIGLLQPLLKRERQA